MNKEEAIKMMAEKGYEEISSDIYFSKPKVGISIFIDDLELKLFFRQKKTFPILFETDYSKIMVNEYGLIHVNNKLDGHITSFIDDELGKLYQAVEESKELRGLK